MKKTLAVLSVAAVAASLAPSSVAHAAKPKPGTTKYYAEEAVQRLGFSALSAAYTVASPIGMITGAVASDIPYAPVRNWGEGMMTKSMSANVMAQQALGLGLRGMTGADPNEPAKVVKVDYGFGPNDGKLKRVGVVVGSHVFAAVGGVLYTAVVPFTTIVGSVATMLPWEGAKQWGRGALQQDVYGAKVSQNFLAFALSGKMVDVPTDLYPLGTYDWGWDDGRGAPTKTTPAPQRPTIGIEPGTHLSLPGTSGNTGFHH